MQLNEIANRYREALETVKQLIKLSQNQLTGLQKNDVVLVNEVIQKQDIVLKIFSKQEKEIVALQDQIVKDYGFREYNLESLKAHLPKEAYLDFSKLQDKLRISLEELKQINDLNNEITKQGLSYIQNMVQTINQIKNQSANRTYSQKGQMQRNDDSSLINKRV